MKPDRDELVDQLLRKTMAGDAPRLPASFDADVMKRVNSGRLDPVGRTIIAVYAVVATAATAWFMRDLPLLWVAAAVAISLGVAAGAGAYGRRIVQGSR